MGQTEGLRDPSQLNSGALKTYRHRLFRLFVASIEDGWILRVDSSGRSGSRLAHVSRPGCRNRGSMTWIDGRFNGQQDGKDDTVSL